MGGCKELHNEKLHSVYSSPDFIRVMKSSSMRWAGHVARMEEMRSAYKIFDSNPEGKISFGRPKCRWEDNIKMDLGEIRFGVVDWINLVQGRDQWRALLNTVTNLRVP
jgi:hypothetical protein